MATYY